MSEKDLVKELKNTIHDLTQDRDDALAKVKTKEQRLKQVMIKLEHATSDVQATGHKIGDLNKKVAELEAKVATKEELLHAKEMYDELARIAVAYGGTVSAEHGIGKIKKHLLSEMVGEAVLIQFRTLKNQIDPNWILGKGTLFDKL